MLVAGTGLNGISVAHLILERGGEAMLYDGDTALKEEDIKAKFDKGAKVNVVLGEIKRSDLLGVELCIINLGIPLDSPSAAIVGDAKIPVLGKIELAYQCAMGKLATITGINRKAITTAPIGEILKTRYEETFMVGNIGNPYIAKMLDMTGESVTVMEVSSLQLGTIMDFRLDVGTILNITPDHLDRHEIMENHIRIKEYITLSWTEQDVVVLNYDDPVLRGFDQDSEFKPRVIWFSSREKLAGGFCMNGDNIVHYQRGCGTVLVDIRGTKLLGRRNYENIMAVTAAGLEMRVSMANITRVAEGFPSMEHRIEFVRERTGVRHYNDPKGTNPDVAVQILHVMPGPTILIVGGYDKNSDYDDWVFEFEGKVKYIVLIGQTRGEVVEYTKKYKSTGIMYAGDMQEAVQVCVVYIDIGGYALLSPACVSWGMFKNYEEHGRIFKECVMALQKVNVYGGKGADNRPALEPGWATSYEPGHKRTADAKEKEEDQTFL